MNTTQTEYEVAPRDEKKPYQRPQLVKHGKVEQQTLGEVPYPNTSLPI